MSHIDLDELSVIALGEPASPADEAHLQQCEQCRSELDRLASVVATSRGITAADRPVAPPESVWSAIVAELGTSQAETHEAAPAAVVPLEQARARRGVPTWLVAAAAAVGLVVGSGLTLGATLTQSDQGAGPELVASATLEPVADSGFRGTAAVEQTGSGAVLRVSVPDLPAVDDGYYEVWMATADAGTMVAIGTLNPGSEATFALPAGMSVGDFPLVDVSVEHFDGDAGHSAVSVVRGQLPA